MEIAVIAGGIGLVVWLVFGFLTAVVASGRGHGGCLWFGSGLLLGPLALPFALLLPEDIAVRTTRLLKAGSHRLCPYCAEAVQAAAVRCRHCAADLSSSSSGVQAG
jgi:hypothetical protein